ncbi:discoidin domain-containing protein, partial [Clostridium celatum]|uniref:discoidin domain-containing protein n=1 Tax=Clostridium celatum TaxID=36834 RepID=UPI00189A1461
MIRRNKKLCVMILSMMMVANSFTYVKAETNVVKTNLALEDGVVATTSDDETSDFTGSKAIDGIVDYENSGKQSRWASNTTSATIENKKWLKIDLGEVKNFDEIVIDWERKNATNYIIEVSSDDTTWRTIEEFTSAPSEYRQVVKLDSQETARYVRLSISNYSETADKRDTDGSNKSITWNTVSVFELEVNQYQEVENLALKGTATANAFEGGALTADKVNDGNDTTRWASEVRSATTENPHWVQIELPEAKTIQSFVINWERNNVIDYEIQISNDGQEWETAWARTSKNDNCRVAANFDQPKTAKYVRVKINNFDQTGTNASGVTNTWNTVSIYEFELYSNKLDLPTYTIDDVVGSITAPVVNKGDAKMQMPEVPEGFELEFVGADYEQIIGADGTIYEPLVDTTVEVNFKVKKGDEERTTAALQVLVPGKYEANVGNEKPKVIPELAEWYGTEGNFEISDSTKIIVDSNYNNELMETANKFASDYEDIMGREIAVEVGTEAVAGSFFLTLATEDGGLCDEGNIITITDSVKIEAKANQGAFYATRSILQILKQTESTLPQGIVRDYPKYKVRGFILDVARKSYELDSLKELAETMAWYKLNDLQVHLNDNYIFLEDYINSDKSNIEDAYDAYSAFRLESDLKNEAGEGITSTDVYYTKDEFREFIQSSRQMGINVVPEIDTPAHALAFTRVFRNLALEGWNPRISNRPVLDHLDLGNPESLEFVKTLFNEYMQGDNPVFDTETTVHVGTDEYEANKEQYRSFTDSVLGHIQDSGRTVRMWGGLTWLDGTTEVRSEGVQLNVWSRDWAEPTQMYNEGYDLINTLDSSLYIVPAAGYYANYLNAQNLYNNWEPNVMAGKEFPAGDDQMLGAAYAIWNDSIDKRSQSVSEYDVFDRFFKALPALAEKMWGEGEDKTYAELNELSAVTGTAPNTNPYYTVESDTPNYVEYDFEEEEILDKSGNGYDSISKKNVSLEAGKKGQALRLNGGESYVETPIKRVGLPNSISFWIKKDGNAPEGEQILFESPSKFDNYAIKAVDANGNVGFTRERDDFSFNYQLPDDEWVYLTITSENERTSLYVNNELVDTLGNRPVATLLIPFERIGSTTNSFKGLIDGIVLGSELPQDETVIDSTNFTVTSDNENSLVNGVEGPAYLAFDNDLNTIWHSNYSPYQALPATIEVDMKEVQNIDKITYIPRQDGSPNGRVLKCEISVKANAEDEYTSVGTFTWDNNIANKYAKFDAVDARYVKISVTEGATNSSNQFASAAEFTIHKVKEETPEIPEEVQAGINMTIAEEVTVGSDFDINVNLSDIKENMYAMEFEVDYDETKVDFKEATSVDADKYFVQAKATDGKVKVVVAGLGTTLENVKDIVKLTFTAKASGENIAFDLINGKVADGEGAEEATKTS